MNDDAVPQVKSPPSGEATSPLDMLRRLEPSVTALVGLASAIKDESFGPLSEEQHQLLDRIVRKSEEVARDVALLERDLRQKKPAARPIRILVVDDDPTNIEVVTIVLRTDGYEVAITEASDAPGAVAMARELQPDMVFMDVRMPGEYDGLEGIRRLKADPQFHGVVVLVSALARPEDLDQGKEAGADAYLTKPFKRKDVVDILDRFADRLPDAKLKPVEKRERFL